MERSSVSALKILQELAELAERLAEKNIVVASLRCDWANSGFWAIHAQDGAATDKYVEGISGPTPLLAAGPLVVKCLWDTRDCRLVMGSSPTIPLSAPNQWTEEANVAVDSHYEAVVRAERFIVERFAKR